MLLRFNGNTRNPDLQTVTLQSFYLSTPKTLDWGLNALNSRNENLIILAILNPNKTTNTMQITSKEFNILNNLEESMIILDDLFEISFNSLVTEYSTTLGLQGM